MENKSRVSSDLVTEGIAILIRLYLKVFLGYCLDRSCRRSWRGRVSVLAWSVALCARVDNRIGVDNKYLVLKHEKNVDNVF